MIRVVIIDDHVVVRTGLRYIIEADPELEFAGEFGGGLGAADFVMYSNPDVVLLDVRMPDRNGIDALKDILTANPRAKVVMLTTSDAISASTSDFSKARSQPVIVQLTSFTPLE